MKSFSDSDETIPSAEINNTSYECQADFHREKQKTKYFLKNQKTNYQIQKFGDNFYNLKHVNLEKLTPSAVAQQIKLTGCPKKAILLIKMYFYHF